MRPSGAVRALRADLAQARDEQVGRVVALVDAMPARGEADALIAVLRPRLAQIRVPRPVGFARLLFLPLDPVIVAAPGWRHGDPALPRSVVPPLAALVRARLGGLARAVEQTIAGATMADDALVRRAGLRLWPAAAEALGNAAAPADWTATTGLPPAAFDVLAPAAAMVLRHAVAVKDMVSVAALGEAPDADVLERMLRGAAAVGQMTMLVAVLMARLPGCATVLALTDELAAAGPARVEADRAVAFMLERMEVAEATPLAQATTELRANAALLRGLEARAELRPGRLKQVQETRRRLGALCHARLVADVPQRLLRPGASLAVASDAEVADLEAAARELRGFAQAAGGLGGREAYDRALSDAARALGPRADDPAGLLADRVRLTELLAGPEAALALLDAASGAEGSMF